MAHQPLDPFSGMLGPEDELAPLFERIMHHTAQGHAVKIGPMQVRRSATSPAPFYMWFHELEHHAAHGVPTPLDISGGAGFNVIEAHVRAGRNMASSSLSDLADLLNEYDYFVYIAENRLDPLVAWINFTPMKPATRQDIESSMSHAFSLPPPYSSVQQWLRDLHAAAPGVVARSGSSVVLANQLPTVASSTSSNYLPHPDDADPAPAAPFEVPCFKCRGIGYVRGTEICGSCRGTGVLS